VGHVDHQIRSNFVGDGSHAREVELARIRAASGYNHPWLLALCCGFEFVVVNGFGVFADLIANDSVEFARKIELVAVSEVTAVSEVEA
jgi:hypothetical protein